MSAANPTQPRPGLCELSGRPVRSSVLDHRFGLRRCSDAGTAVSQSELLESEKVARVELKGALQVTRGLVPVAFAAVDHPGVSEYISVVGHCAPGDNELTASPSVIAESVVVINGEGEVGFARIRLEAQSSLHGRISQTETGRRVVGGLEVGRAMYSGQQTPCEQQLRIVCDSFVEQLGRLRQLLPGMDWVRCTSAKSSWARR